MKGWANSRCQSEDSGDPTANFFGCKGPEGLGLQAGDLFFLSGEGKMGRISKEQGSEWGTS